MRSDHCSDPVTVVIPCFNQSRFLDGAIRSVQQQFHAVVECIVVDDGSTDDTLSVAARMGVRIIRQANRGVAEARNAGLAAAQTEFIVFLDADDELMPDAVALGGAALRAHASAAVAVGRCQPIDSFGRELPVVHEEIEFPDLYGRWLARNFVWTPGAAMFRRESLQSIGGFPAGVGGAADYAVYLKLARDGRVLVLPHRVVRYRQHDSSMSRDPASMLRATLTVLRREEREGGARRDEVAHGRSAWCEWYGEQIVESLRTDWRAGYRGWKQLRAAATLARHCPGVLLRHLARKARVAGARLLRYARGAIRPASAEGRRAAR